MKKIVLTLAATVSVVVLLFGYHTSTAGSMAATSETSVISGGTSAATAPSESASPSAGSSSSGSSSSTKKSTVTGSVAQTQWGPVQVELSLSGDTITDVSVLQYPNGNGKDQEINSYALPILIQETIDNQSANIDMVSGATVTSDGYLQSLQSALDQVSSS